MRDRNWVGLLRRLGRHLFSSPSSHRYQDYLSPSLSVLPLEERRVLSVSPVSWNDQTHTLTINAGQYGADGTADSYAATQQGNNLAVSVNGQQVYSAAAGEVSAIKVCGSTDQDTLSLDATGLLSLGVTNVSFDATANRDGSTDVLTIQNGSSLSSLSSLTHQFDSLGSGSINITLGATQAATIDYSGVKLVQDYASADQLSLILTSASDSAVLGNADSLDGGLSLSTSDGTSVIFAAPTSSLSVQVESSLDSTTLSVTGDVACQGGTVKIDAGSEGTLLVSGSIDVSDSTSGGTGGTVELLGDKVGLIDDATIDASGDAGGGTVLIGGDYQGANSDIRNASYAYVGEDVSISADAITTGEGGKVIVWSNDATRFYGSISAQGGLQSGDGGFVEVSGGHLDFQGFVSTLAPHGTAGMLLLDPTDVTIDSAEWATIKANLTGGNLTVAADNSITVSEASPDLASGNSLILQAGTTIDVNASITNTGSGSLSLTAGTTVTIAGTITTTTLNVDAPTLTMTSGSATLNGPCTATTVNVNGGTLTLGAANVLADTATVNVSGGTLAMTGGYDDTIGTLNVNSGSLTGDTTTVLTATTYNLAGGTVTASFGFGTINVTGNMSGFNATVLSKTININGGSVTFGSGSMYVIYQDTVVTVNSGTLTLGSSLMFTSTYHQTGGTLEGAGKTLATGGFALSGGTINNVTFADHTGSCAVTVSGTVMFNGSVNVTPVEIVSGGTLTLGVSNCLSDSTAVTVSGGTLDMGSNSDRVGSFTMSSGTLGGSGTLTASTYTLSGGTVNAKLGAGAVTIKTGTVALGSAERLNLDATLEVQSGQLTLAGAERVSTYTQSGGTLAGSSYTLTASTYALSGGTVNAKLGAGAVTVTTGTVALGSAGRLDVSETLEVQSGQLTLGGDETVTTYTQSGGTLAGSSYTLTARTYALSGGTVNAKLGTGAMTVSGPVTLNNASDATTVTITSGTLTLGAADVLADTATVNVSGGTLAMTGGYDDTIGTLNINSGSLTGDTTTVLTATDYNLAGGTVTARLGSGTINVTGDMSGFHAWVDATAININGGSVNFGSMGGLELSHVVVTLNSGTLTLGGRLVIAAKYYQTGGTLVGAGDSVAFATDGFSLSGGTINSVMLTMHSATPRCVMTVSGNVVLNGRVSLVPAEIVSGGTLTLGAADRLSDGFGVTVSGGSLNMATYTDTVGSFTMTSGSIIGTGTLTASDYDLSGGTVDAKLGGGTMTVSGPVALNNTSGATSVTITETGELTLGGDELLANAADVTIRAGGKLSLGGHTETIDALSDAGEVSSSGTSTGTFTVGANNGSGIFSGVISGATAVTKTGSGTLTLSGSNNFTGDLTVSEGTLALGANNVLSDSVKVTVSGGSLNMETYTDTVDSFTITSGSLDGSGTLTGSVFNDYNLQGGTINANLGTGTAAVRGTVTLNGTAAISRVSIYSGAKLTLGANERLADTAAAWVVAGGILDLGTFTETVDTVNGWGGITGSSGSKLIVGGNNGSSTFNGIIANALAMEKIGSGTATLRGANTFTGGLTISEGTLALGVSDVLSNSLAVTVAGGTLDTGSNGDTVGSFTMSSGSLSGTGKLTAITYALSGGTVDAKLGSGTMTVSGDVMLNNTSDATTITITNTGTLRLGADELLANTADVTINSGGALNLGGHTETIDELIDAGSVTGTTGAKLTVGDNDGTTEFSGVISGEMAIAKTGSGTLTLSGANEYKGGTTISEGTLRLGNATALSDASSSVVVVSGAVLDLNGQTVANTNPLTINGTGIGSGGALINSNSTAASYAGTVALGSDSSIGGAGQLTLSGVVSGAYNLAKIGAGTLVLSGINTFGATKTFTISEGTVQLGNAAGLGDATDSVVVNSGAVLDLNGQNVTRTNALTLNGTGISGGGALVNNYSGGGIYSGNVTLASDTSIGGSLGFNLTGVVSGDYNLTKVGNGTLGLFGNNTFGTGKTFTISGGFVNVGGGGTTGMIGNASIVNNAHLVFLRSDTITVNNQISGSGDVGIANGTVILSGDNSYTGSTLINSGTLQLDSDSALGKSSIIIYDSAAGSVLDLNGHTVTDTVGLSFYPRGGATYHGAALINSSSTAASYDGTVWLNSDASISIGGAGKLTLTGVISGAHDLTKIGAGTLVLSGANTFGGAKTFTISEGTVQLGNAAGLGDATDAVVVASGAVLDLNGQTVTNTNPLTINGTGISSGGALINSSSTAASYAGTVALGSDSSIGGSGQLTLSGVVTGTHGFAKIGAGTLILTGASNYTGTTTVSSGTLLVNGSTTSNTAVKASAVLGGTGTVNGSVTVEKDGFITGGTKGAVGTITTLTDEVGTLTVGSLYFNGGTYWADVYANASDSVAVSTAVDLAQTEQGIFTLNVLGGTTSGGTAFALINNTGTTAIVDTPFSGAAEGGTATVNGNTAYYTYKGGDGANDFVLRTVGDVTITGTAADETFTITRVNVVDGYPTSGNIRVQLSDGTVLSYVYASVEKFTINAGNGDDKFVVDWSGGLPVSSNGFFLNGQTSSTTTGDSLEITNLAATTVAFSATAAGTDGNNGSIDIDGSFITYTGLEPIAVNTATPLVAIQNIIFNFNGLDATETIDMASGAAGFNVISSDHAESVTFANPTTSLTINAGNGDDTVNFNSIDSGFRAAVTINTDDGTGADKDTVNLYADLTLGSAAAGSIVSTGKLEVNAESIKLGVLAPNVDPLSISTNAAGAGFSAGSVKFDGNVVLATNTVTIDTAGVAAGDNGGDVTFTGTIDADDCTVAGQNRTLNITAGTGTITLQGHIGNDTNGALAGLDVTAAKIKLGVNMSVDGATIINVDDENAAQATARFNGAVILESSLTIDTNKSTHDDNNLTFTSTIDADNCTTGFHDWTLTIDAGTGGTVTFQDNIGTGTNGALAGLDVTAKTIKVGANNSAAAGTTTIKVDDEDAAQATARFNGPMVLESNLAVDTDKVTHDDNNVTFTSTIDADDSTSHDRTLAINAGTGAVTLQDSIGNGTNGALADLDVTAATIRLGVNQTASGTTTIKVDDATTADTVTFTGAVILESNVALDTDGAVDNNVTFTSTIDADDSTSHDRTLAINAGTGAVTLQDSIGNGTNGALADLDVTAATIKLGVNQTTSGTTTIKVNDATTADTVTFTGAMILESNVALDTDGAVDNNVTFTSTIDADDSTSHDRTLAINAGTGTVTLQDSIGNGTNGALADLDVTAATIKLGVNQTASGTTTIKVNDATTADTVTFTGAVILESNVALDTDGAVDNNVKFTTTIDADDSTSHDRTLAINAGTGAVTLQDSIGNGTNGALADLDVTAATIRLGVNQTASGTTTIKVNDATTAGTVTFTGAVILESNVALDTDGAVDNNVTFTSTIDADDSTSHDRTLAINAGTGAVTLQDSIGNGTNGALADLDVTAATIKLGVNQTTSGTTTIKVNDATTADTVTFTGAMILESNVALDTDGAVDNNVTFTSTIDADDSTSHDRTLAINAGTGTVTLQDSIGNGTNGALADLDVTAATIKLGVNQTASGTTTIKVDDATTADTVTFTGAVILESNVALDTDGVVDNDVKFTSTIDADDSTSHDRTLAINAGAGIVTLQDSIGNGTNGALADLDVTAATIRLGVNQTASGTTTIKVNDATTADTVTFTGAVILESNVALDTDGAVDNDVKFTSTIDADNSTSHDRTLAVNAGTGIVTLQDSIGNGTNGALADLDVTAATIRLGVNQTASGTTTIKVNDATTADTVTFTGAVILESNVALDTDGVVDNDVKFTSTIDVDDSTSHDRTLAVNAGAGIVTLQDSIGNGTNGALADLDVTAATIKLGVNQTVSGTTTIKVDDATTADTVTFTGAVILESNVALDTDGVVDNDVKFTSTIDVDDSTSHDRTLAINAGTGIVTLQDSIGNGTNGALADLDVTAATIKLGVNQTASGTTTIKVNDATTADTVTFTGAVILESNVALDTDGVVDNDVKFTSTIDADDSTSHDRTLAINAGAGIVTLQDSIGNGTNGALADLDVTAATIRLGVNQTASGTTTIKVDDATTAGTVTFTGAVILESNVALDTDGVVDNDVKFTSTIDVDDSTSHDRTLAVNAGAGIVTLQDSIGNGTNGALADLDVTAATIRLGVNQTASGTTTIKVDDATTAGTVTFTGAVILESNVALDTDGVVDNDVKYTSTIDADDSTSHNRTLAVNAGTGIVTLQDSIGNGTNGALADLDVTAATIKLGVNQTASGTTTIKVDDEDAAQATVTFTGTVILESNVMIDTDKDTHPDNNVTFIGTIDADNSANGRALTITAGAADTTTGVVAGNAIVTFNGKIGAGANGKLEDLTVTAQKIDLTNCPEIQANDGYVIRNADGTYYPTITVTTDSTPFSQADLTQNIYVTIGAANQGSGYVITIYWSDGTKYQTTTDANGDGDPYVSGTKYHFAHTYDRDYIINYKLNGDEPVYAYVVVEIPTSITLRDANFISTSGLYNTVVSNGYSDTLSYVNGVPSINHSHPYSDAVAGDGGRTIGDIGPVWAPPRPQMEQSEVVITEAPVMLESQSVTEVTQQTEEFLLAPESGAEETRQLYIVRVGPDGKEGEAAALPEEAIANLNRFLDQLRRQRGIPNGWYRIYLKEIGFPKRMLVQFYKSGESIGEPQREPGRGRKPLPDAQAPRGPQTSIPAPSEPVAHSQPSATAKDEPVFVPMEEFSSKAAGEVESDGRASWSGGLSRSLFGAAAMAIAGVESGAKRDSWGQDVARVLEDDEDTSFSRSARLRRRFRR